MDAGTNEILVGAAFFVGTVIATVVAYLTKKPPPAQHEALIAGRRYGDRHILGRGDVVARRHVIATEEGIKRQPVKPMDLSP